MGRCMVIGQTLDAINRLFGMLDGKGRDQGAFARWDHEMVQKMGPLIMTLCTKKRRLCSCTDAWHAVQSPFLRLLHNCVGAAGAGPIETFLKTTDSLVLQALADTHRGLHVRGPPSLFGP